MFYKKLKLLRNQKNLTQLELAKDLNVTKGAIAMWETNKRNPDHDMLVKIAEYFNVSVDYLIGKTTNNDDTIKNIFPISKKKIPFLGEIACGEPIFAAEERESYVMAGTDINADFCLKAKGDSMTGARILNGDIVFIKQMPTVNNGEIAAVIIDNEATLKRVYFYPEKGKLVLQAENPKYEPMVFIGEELNEIRILGKAVAFQSDII